MRIHPLRLGVLLCAMATALGSFAQNEESAEDYKTACQAAIDNIEQISSGTAIRSATSVARTALRFTSNKNLMSTAMTTLRGSVTAYLQADNNVTDDMDMTGLLGNHSFDTGGLSKWYGIGIDESKINVGAVTSAIMKGDLAELAGAVNIGSWKESTQVTPNSDATAMADSDKKYHLRSEQMIAQPLIGLPAGIYELSMKGSCTPGLLKLNKVHLSALVVPAEVATEILGDASQDITKLQEFIRNFDLAKYITTFMQKGKLKTNPTTPKNIDTFADCKLRFAVGRGDIVIIGINAGALPFLSTNAFRADNVRLNLIRSSHGILDIAKDKLAIALSGLSEVTANYDKTDTLAVEPAFTFRRSLTKAYNEAFRTATNKYYYDDITDIEDMIDLNNTDNISSAIENIYDKDIEILEKADKAFREGALIMPKPETEYNIVMEGGWQATGFRWLNNAITVTETEDGTMSMAFSNRPGTCGYAQAVRFEPETEATANTVLASIPTDKGTYYIANAQEGLYLTTEKEKAIPLTIDLSHRLQGSVSLLSPDSLCLGATDSGNEVALTGKPTPLSRTFMDLSVTPAAETSIAANIPANGVASFILPFDSELPEGMEAFSVTGIGGESGITLQLTPESQLKASKPYIILGKEGRYTFSGKTYNTAKEHREGLLTGTFSDRLTSGNEYIPADMYGTTVFSIVAPGNTQVIPANQCFILPQSAIDSPYLLLKDEDADGMASTLITSSGSHERLHDLLGRTLSPNTKGIFIKNGRKYLTK